MLSKKPIYLVVLMVFAIPFLAQTSIAAATASFVDSSGNPVNFYFGGTSTDPGYWYEDANDGNPDAAVEICGVGQQYAGGAYAINVGGTWKYVLVTYGSDTDALSNANQDVGNSCYRSAASGMTISPSYLSSSPTPSPPVYFAAFPGKLWVAYAGSPNPGTLSNFILTDQALLGDYTIPRTFNQSSDRVVISTPTISFQTESGPFTKLATDSTFGVSNKRRMVIGICSDQTGSTCADGDIVYEPTQFPLKLNPGVSPIDDKHAYHEYVVINGIGKPICIGANLKATINSVQPNPVYYSQILDISYTISNFRTPPNEESDGGNVDVTDGFDVKTVIYPQGNSSDIVFTNITHIYSLPSGSSRTITVHWNATAHSGTYVVKVIADPDNNIVECDENDNTDSKTFVLKPIILPTFYINGKQTTVFPHPGIPYNVTIHLKNSDNDTVSNATVRLTQTNGISPFVPLQIWNATTNSSGGTKTIGTVVNTTVALKTDYQGNAKLTIIPTGNPIYSPEYAYLHPKTVIGNYSISLSGTAYNGDPFVFVRNGEVYHNYKLGLSNTYNYSYEYNATIGLPNRGSVVDLIMNAVYTIFSKFWKAVTL